MQKLTDKAVKNLKPETKEYQVNSDSGMYVRVLPTGIKTFWYRFTVGGKRGKLNLGNYPDVKLADAHEKHEDAKKLVRKGIDPRAKAAEPPDPERPFTIKLLVDEWLKWSLDNHSLRVQNNHKYTLLSSVIPILGDKPVEELKRKDVIALLEAKAKTHPGQAMNILKCIRQIYSFALLRELAENNPAAGINIVAAIPSMMPKDRERSLSDNEIRTLWPLLGAQGGSTATILALRLILLTAQRPGEVAGMRWDEIVWGVSKPLCSTCRRCGWWTIPASKSKNCRENRVYLSPPVVELMHKHGSESEYVCSDIEANAIAYHVRRDVESTGKVPFYGLPRWTPHDLRRTAATELSHIGCTDEVIDSILNHQKQGVIKIYNRNKYDKEKHVWLTKWAEHLFEIVKKTGKMA
jgi:integrase